MDRDLATRAPGHVPAASRITSLSGAELAEIAEAWPGLPVDSLADGQALIAAARHRTRQEALAATSRRLLDARVAAVWSRSGPTDAVAKRALEILLWEAHANGCQLPAEQTGSTRDLSKLWNTDSAGVFRMFDALAPGSSTKKTRKAPGPCFALVRERPRRGDQWRPWRWTLLDPLRILNVQLSSDGPRLFGDDDADGCAEVTIPPTSLTAGVTTEVSLPVSSPPKTPSDAATSTAKKSDRATVAADDCSAEERAESAALDRSAARDVQNLNLSRFEVILQELLQTKSESDFDAIDRSKLAAALRQDVPAIQNHFARKVVRGLCEGNASAHGIVEALAASMSRPNGADQFPYFHGCLRNQCPALLPRREDAEKQPRRAAEASAAQVTTAVSLPAKTPAAGARICAKARHPCHCCQKREAAGNHGYCEHCAALDRKGRNKLRRQLEVAGEIE